MGRYKLPYTMYKRGKYWYFRTYDSSGNLTTAKSTGITSKREAQNYLNELYKNNSLYRNEITFRGYAEHFLDPKSPYILDRTTKLSAASLKLYRNNLNNYLLPELGNEKMMNITYTRLKQLRADLLHGGLAPSSVSGVFSLLKKIIMTAFRDNIINKNPFEAFEGITYNNAPRDAFNLEEIKFLISKLPEYKNFILLMALTGMRISEANGVRINDVKEENGILYIDLQKQLVKHRYEPLKNKQSRLIPITEEIKTIILSEELSQPKFYRLFVPVERQCINAAERNLCAHSLRHFFITNAKSEGVNPIKVEKIAGHSLKGIQEVYTNFSVQDLAEITLWQKKTFEKLF